MPYVNCPSCALSLKYQIFDTSVRCSLCAIDVAIPEPEPGPPIPEPPPSSAVSLTPFVRSTGDAWMRTPLRVGFDPAEWRQCWIGLRLARIGIAIYAPVQCLVTILGASLAFSVMHVQRPGSLALLQMAILALGVLVVVAALVHLVGQIVCCQTPAPQRVPAVRAMSYLLIAVLTAAIFVAITLTLATTLLDRRAMRDLMWFPVAAGFLILALLLVYLWNWIAYLAGVASKFGKHSLAEQCWWYFGLQVTGLAIYVAALALTHDRPDANQIVVFVYGFVGCLFSFWYLFILSDLNETVRNAVEK